MSFPGWLALRQEAHLLGLGVRHFIALRLLSRLISGGIRHELEAKKAIGRPEVACRRLFREAANQHLSARAAESFAVDPDRYRFRHRGGDGVKDTRPAARSPSRISAHPRLEPAVFRRIAVA